ncbi:hypothetical protein FB451DRAFT_1519766 [Mycena latifolia]|nr:hypothetical protein FB451DRAFT_1519766 [Mycena latifolia]
MGVHYSETGQSREWSWLGDGCRCCNIGIMGFDRLYEVYKSVSKRLKPQAVKTPTYRELVSKAPAVSRPLTRALPASPPIASSSTRLTAYRVFAPRSPPRPSRLVTGKRASAFACIGPGAAGRAPSTYALLPRASRMSSSSPLPSSARRPPRPPPPPLSSTQALQPDARASSTEAGRIVFNVKITMRGAERPANNRWTHPFLEPLKPLALDAARQTFIDIADNGHTLGEIDRILLLVDNMPLAIDLIAHLVDCEGYASVLDRWEKERTPSLESSRMLSMPESRDLLSLLSILPNCLSDTDLVQSKPPIDNILACKTVLLGTSLAYTDGQKRLKALVPIRQYMQKTHPPTARIVQPLRRYFQEPLEVYETYHGTVSNPGTVARITSNFANIHNILLSGLNRDNPDFLNTIYCTCHFDHFSFLAGRGYSPIIELIPDLLPHPRNHRLEVYFNIRLLVTTYRPTPRAQHIVDQALESFPYFDDPDLKCRYYDVLAIYFCDHKTPDTPRAINLALTGLSLAISTGKIRRQSDILSTLALLKWTTGDYSGGQEHAYESQRLAKISGNSYKEAWALNMEAMCWYSLGNYKDNIPLCKRARDLLHFCGMSGGRLDHYIMGSQAEIHQLKSEYLEARNIRTQILDNCSIEQNPQQHVTTLISIAQIDVEIGVSKHELHKNMDVVNQLSESIGYPMGTIWTEEALKLNVDDLKLIPLLQQLPSLRTLDLCHCADDALFKIFTYDPREPVPSFALPHLTSLTIIDYTSHLDGRIIADMVESVCAHAGGQNLAFPALATVELELDGRSFSEDVEYRIAAASGAGFVKDRGERYQYIGH